MVKNEMAKNVKLGQLEDIGIWKHADQSGKAYFISEYFDVPDIGEPYRLVLFKNPYHKKGDNTPYYKAMLVSYTNTYEGASLADVKFEHKSRSNQTVDGLTVDQAMCVVQDAVAQILYGESKDDVIIEARADLETLVEHNTPVQATNQHASTSDQHTSTHKRLWEQVWYKGENNE